MAMATLSPGWKLLALPVFLIVVGYFVLLLSACTLADRALYHPNFASRRAPAGLQKIRTTEGAEIALLHLPNPKARYTVWFFHGNAESLGDLEPFLLVLRDAGFAVVAHDYPGYGLSSGSPSETAIYASARAVRTFMREDLKIPASRTLMYGRSLGGGPAVQMAKEETPAGLVLECAFASVFRVVTRWRVLPFDQFENESKIPDVKCPVLVMHGEADEVIPFRHGEALFAAAKEPKRALWIPGAHHNDFGAVAGARYWEALRDFSALCAQRGGSSP